MLRYLTIAMFAIATNAAGQTIYQCRSAAGHVTLQDAPCQHHAKTELVRKSIGQRNAEYRAEPSSFFDPKGQERLASRIVCPSLRQSYLAAVTHSERAMLTHNSVQIRQASEAVQRAGSASRRGGRLPEDRGHITRAARSRKTSLPDYRTRPLVQAVRNSGKSAA
jgi:hypothetical protein